MPAHWFRIHLATKGDDGMEFLADTILDYLKEQIRTELAKPDKSKLIYIMPSFPSHLVTRIGESITDFADSQQKNVRLVFKVSYALGKNWSESDELIDKQAYEYITQMDWYDSGDHLTSIRNLTRSSEDDLLVIILMGTDQVTDKSSLDDFHKVDTSMIWNNLLKRSFIKWLEKKLGLSMVFYEKETLKHFDDILTTLKERGLADIIQISNFLQQIDFSSAQTDKDALHLILKELRGFNLPFMRKIPFDRGREFKDYAEDALSFFSYSDYIDNTKRNKALDTIKKFREKFQDNVEDSIEQDDRTGYTTANEFLSELSEYIENNDSQIKTRLYKANFVIIRDKILGFKVKKPGGVKKETIKKLSGNPIEVVLHALWLTLADFKKETDEQGVPAYEAIREIIIKSQKFKHDFQGENAREEAKSYICKLIGGIDKLIEKHISIAISDPENSDGHICISSKLVPDDDDEANYPSARTGEPCLEFNISIKSGDDYEDFEVSRNFAWRLPENQPYRVSYELFERVDNELKSISGFCLPCFTVPYYNELMLAKDDEEACRVLLQCVKSEVNHVVNLLDNKDIVKDDPLYPKIQKLANDYEHFISDVVQNGLFNALIGFPSGLQRAYEEAYSGYLAEKSYFGPILFRAFMILHEHDPEGGKSWYWEEYESSAVITLLHPALLEMLDKQIVYLFTCFNYLAEKELKSDGARGFQEDKWSDLSQLAEIKTPIAGILYDKNRTLNTDLRGMELLHRIGNIKESSATLTTRLLLRYDSSEDEEISDTELFQYSKESELFKRILNDYHSLHPHADDGISIAVYVNDAIQPVIAGIDSFIQDLFETRKRRFSLALTIFTENQDDTSLTTWLDEWKDRWGSADSSQKFQHYRKCRILVSQRLVSSERHYEQFQSLISEGLEVDVAFLMHFIKAGGAGNEFQLVSPYDVRKRTLLFPILEKAFCALKDPGKTLQRARVISNRQFRLSALHSEVMARLRHPNIVSQTKHVKIEHVVLGVGDFSEWARVVDKLHEKAEWVICIDPCVDERLLKKENSSGEKREIIGFGSGVGPHGELNYTISTEQFRLSDIRRKITEQVHTLFGPWEKEFSESIAISMLKEVPRLSGLSVVRATGIADKGVRDFMAYSLTRKLLKTDENIICDELISLDAYSHWFDTAESNIRPDLLWLTAFMEEGLIHVKTHLIECKLAQKSEAHEDKAHEQLEKGLQHLMTCFKPRTGISAEDEDRRPDQRYWWLQLHRLIASKGMVSRNEESDILSALEMLSEGDFSIEWTASAVTYWTDDESDEMKSEKYWDFSFDDNRKMRINVVSIGREFVKLLCAKEINMKLPPSGQFIRFEPLSKDKESGKAIDSNGLDESLNGKDSTSTPDNTSEIITNLPDKQPISVVKMPERIFLGASTTGNRKIYWEFGHPELPNRHILIFGASGMGKTYTIQAILCELGIVGQNSLIVDYTNGFDDKQIEKVAKRVLHPEQHIVRKAPLPINPFRRQHNFIDDNDIPETSSDVAQRVSGVFNEVYNFGDQQKSVLYSAIKESLELLNWEMSLPELVERLESIAENGGFLGNSASTLLSRIKPYVDISPFGREDPESWEKLFKDAESRCHIIQLATYPKDAARLITEFSLIDLYWYYRGKGSKDIPRVIVLDEIQNLDHRLESPLGQFLTEGRKFGISLILATQTLSNLQKDERDRLFQASHKLFFKPADTEIKEYAQILQNNTGEKQDVWISRLASLKKGECYSLGPSKNEANNTLETKPFKIHIDSLEIRFNGK